MMTKQDLVKRLSLGKSGAVELQGSYSPDAVCRSICSFLNFQGGFVICGMGKGISAEQIQLWQSEIADKCNKEIHPHAPVFVHTQSIEGQHILVVEVPEGKDKPFAFGNQVYIRNKGASRPEQAGIETIKEMIFAQQTQPLRWERMFSDEIEPEMFSKDELGKLNSVMPFHNDSELMSVLEKMSLMRQGRLTNAADILLTENPAIRHPQIRVRAACFVNKTDDQYQDYKIFAGPALQILEEVLHFIERNTASQAVFIEGKAQREMRSQYPMNAVREGLVNAFAHRDYASYSGGIRIEIGRDTLSIWNSGKLPEGVSLKTLKEGHVSVLRNPDIANYFHVRNYMEMLGRGSILIQRECREAGNKEPQWEADETGVTLRFIALEPESRPELRPESRPMSKTDFERNTTKRPMTGPMTGPMLNDLQKAIMQAEEENSKIGGILKVLTIEPMSQTEMAAALSLNSVSGALKRAVKTLELQFHFIEKTLPDKARSRNQRYRLTDLGRQYLEETKP